MEHLKLAKLKVWWIPQVPMKAFEVDVEDIAEGKKLLDILGRYDQFQFENRIKPDYCNMGGLVWSHPTATDGWEDYPDDEDEREILEEDFNNRAPLRRLIGAPHENLRHKVHND